MWWLWQLCSFFIAPAQADNPLQIEQAFAAYHAGDYSQALRLFKPLAQQGNAEAQNSLGVMYAKGQGVAQDYQQALAWYKKSGESGRCYCAK